ncbi:hypothetical protein L6475_01025 [Prevotella sp. E9-3]|uniref:hypothetical protein n=1 Tax=Prevotella sp. E9-3 TaxID=2913621 RepID=UPI001EDC7907|nr:hypothetical protein [Prevotella sp. E9-3]UKK48577.1 hypothetical protein L6475_01025 [Prevotella sp. E9-3]
MKKVYLKPAIELLEEELTQMLCSSTVINPGEPNKPAGARESGWDLWDDEEDNPSGSGSFWDE